ncbi:MAG TPA: hypothetical protein VHR18_01640 [Solirubrobacterales bacterium]|jgi:hypothetical protein|nr:hypothetical protein [Solirubrobacterales bacterium]
MAPNRIIPSGVVRRAALLAAACLLLALALGACGGGGGDSGESTVVADREHDAEVLNQILGRQRAAIDLYDRILPDLEGQALALATRFRAQEQEHTVALLAALRDLDGEEEVEDEEIESGELRTEADRLRFLYAVESVTIEDEIGAIGRLEFGGPRALLSATVANQAQRLALLRRQLGAKPLEWVPSAFESGTTPAP